MIHLEKLTLISIGILTHRPYYSNYETLIKELVRQVKEEKEAGIEIISVIQIPPSYKGDEPFLQKDYKGHDDIDIVKLIHRNLNPSEARNEILRCSNGEWISFIDGDCLPHESYVHNLVKAVLEYRNNHDVGAFQGGILGYNMSRFGKYEYIRDVLSLYVGRNMKYIRKLPTNANSIADLQSTFDNKELVRLQGYNCIVSKEVVNLIGEFDENIESAEDRDYAGRILNSGKKIIVKSNIMIYHDYNMTLKRILYRKKWHAKGGAYLIVAYPDIHPWGTKARLKYIMDALSLRNPFNKSFYSSIYYITSTISYLRGLEKELRLLKKDAKSKSM